MMSFEEFHEENPRVYDVMVRLAREYIARTGRRHLGMAQLRERVRWEIAMKTSDPDFKINNNYTPYYARLIMTREPDLDGIFALRRSVADEYFASAA